MAPQVKPSIVFSHGIWADGSCFSKVIPALQAEGYEVMAAQYGLDSNVADVAATLRTLGQVRSPAILVGHSYGGTVITAAGTDDRVAGLVYICALGPDEYRDLPGPAGQVPQTPVFSQIDVADGRVSLKPSGIGCFCGDLPEEGQRWSMRPFARPPTCPAQRPRRRVADEAILVHRRQQRPTVHPDLERASASGSAPRPTTSTAAASPCPTPTTSSTSSGPPQEESVPRGYHALDDDWAAASGFGRHWLAEIAQDWPES